MTPPQLLGHGCAFSYGRIWTLVWLLADAVNDPDPPTQLYGDGLTVAIAVRHFADPKEPTTVNAGGVEPWQLRRVVSYLIVHLPNYVALADAAALVDLSQSHFNQAFKTSTGMAPLRWRLDAHIRRNQTLLLDTCSTFDQVADATGFADAFHFGRTFRKLIRATPAV